MDELEKQRKDTFDFIVAKAMEPEYQPEFIRNNAVVQTLGIQKQKEELLEEKRQWLKNGEEEKKREDPIERYCHDIRGEVPNYAITFEQYKKEEERAWQERRDVLEKEQGENTMYLKPERMTEKQWVKERRKRKRLQQEEMKHRESDEKLERHSPFHLFEGRVHKIGCECKAEEMRRGIFYDTCKLIVKVNEHMLSYSNKLLKEGQLSIHV
jgi:hypothetical protein